MDRSALAALIHTALLDASRRPAPDGYPLSPSNVRLIQEEPGKDIKPEYEMQQGEMEDWMARVLADGVASGIVQHLTKDLKVVSSVIVDTLGVQYGSVASTGLDIVVPLDITPRLALLHNAVTTALRFQGMPSSLRLTDLTLPSHEAGIVTLGTNSITIGSNVAINPPGGVTIYWFVLGTGKAHNARGTSTAVA